jgi:ABC-2 type transport system ATP-binding protein
MIQRNPSLLPIQACVERSDEVSGSRLMPSNTPDQSPNFITAQGVTMQFPVAKRYRELLLHPFRPRQVVTALESVNLEVKKGDRIALLGPNGAGKTTLLKLIGGLLLPTHGEIAVNGYNTLRHNSAARKSVGFVMNEERSFFWRLNAIQNLEFFAALDNLSGKAMEERVRDLIHFVGLDSHVEKSVDTYSSGMKQRLALARGLIAEPEVLILDEPTRALDPVACEDLNDLIIERLHKGSRKTLLVATHRLEEAIRLCDKVLVINQGKIMAFNLLSELITQGISLSDYYRLNVTPKHS